MRIYISLTPTYVYCTGVSARVIFSSIPVVFLELDPWHLTIYRMCLLLHTSVNVQTTPLIMFANPASHFAVLLSPSRFLPPFFLCLWRRVNMPRRYPRMDGWIGVVLSATRGTCLVFIDHHQTLHCQHFVSDFPQPPCIVLTAFEKRSAGSV